MIAITVKFLNGLVQSGERLRLHIGMDPALVVAALRYDDDERKARFVQPDGVGNADVGG